MKRLRKKAETNLNITPTLYTNESGEFLKEEVIDEILELIDYETIDSDITIYRDGGYEGEVTGIATLKWTDLINKLNIEELTDADMEAIADTLRDIDELNDIFRDELESELPWGVTIDSIDMTFNFNIDSLIIEYRADELSYDRDEGQRQWMGI